MHIAFQDWRLESKGSGPSPVKNQLEGYEILDKRFFKPHHRVLFARNWSSHQLAIDRNISSELNVWLCLGADNLVVLATSLVSLLIKPQRIQRRLLFQMLDKFVGAQNCLGESMGFFDVVDDRYVHLRSCPTNVDAHKNFPFEICVKLARKCVHQA